MVNWSEHTKRTLPFNCSNTTQNKTKARKARRRCVLIVGKPCRRVRRVSIVGKAWRRFLQTRMKTTISCLKPKLINYRNYKKEFLLDMQQEHFECKSRDINENYENVVQELLKIISNRVPLNSKTVKGNNVSLMNKNWRKAIYERTHLKNIYNKNRSRDSYNNYENQRYLSTNLRKKNMKHHFRNVSDGKLFSSNRVTDSCRDGWNVRTCSAS